MTQLMLLFADPADDHGHDHDDEKEPPKEVRDARRKLEEAIEARRREQEDVAPVATGGKRGLAGQKVDKYFGEKLPPICARLGCYVTDDGKRYYCVNPGCQKHKKRETKHTRRGRPKKSQFAYFRCPRCDSRSIEMHILRNEYACRACKYTWKR